MAERELEIRYKIDSTQAQAAANRAVADLARIQAASRRAVESQERAFIKAATDGEKSFQRQAVAAEKAAKQAQAAQEKAMAKVIAAQQKAADEQQKAIAKALDADLKAIQKRSDASSRAARKAVEDAEKRFAAEARAAQRIVAAEVARVAKLDALGKQQLSREEVQLRARAQANQRFQQQRVDAAARAMAGERESSEESGLLADAANRVVGSFLGFSAAERAIRAVSDAIRESRETSEKWAEQLLKTKDDLSEIATLRGLAFADDSFIKEMGQFSRATGMSMHQGDEFQKQLFGSSAGGLQLGNVDEDTLKRAGVLTGQAAVRQTKDFRTRGDLVGMLTQFRKYDKGQAGAQQIATDAEAVRLALTEGRGDDAPLTQSLLKVAGAMGGEGKAGGTMPELAALVGTTSLFSGAMQADTWTEQLHRGLMGTTAKQMEFWKSFAGVEETDNIERRLDKIVPRLRAEKAKGRDIQSFLVENGMGAEGSRALVSYAGTGYETYKQRVAKSRKAVDPGKVAEQNAAFAASSLGRQKMGQADLFAAQLEQGKKREALQSEMDAARAELVREGMGTDWTYQFGNLLRAGGSGFTIGGEQQRVEERAIRRMRERAGIRKEDSPFGFLEDQGPLAGLGGNARLMGQIAGKDVMAEAANYYRDIQAGGADPKAQAELQKQTGLLERILAALTGVSGAEAMTTTGIASQFTAAPAPKFGP